MMMSWGRKQFFQPSVASPRPGTFFYTITSYAWAWLTQYSLRPLKHLNATLPSYLLPSCFDNMRQAEKNGEILRSTNCSSCNYQDSHLAWYIMSFQRYNEQERTMIGRHNNFCQMFFSPLVFYKLLNFFLGTFTVLASLRINPACIHLACQRSLHEYLENFDNRFLSNGCWICSCLSHLSAPSQTNYFD